ncbi:hypothetical protein D3C72_2200720 [compost metagenome]
MARNQPRRDCNDQADDHQKTDIRAKQLGSRNRARMRRHKHMHAGECSRDRNAVEQKAAAKTPCHCEHHRQHDNKSCIKEDRETKEK